MASTLKESQHQTVSVCASSAAVPAEASSVAAVSAFVSVAVAFAEVSADAPVFCELPHPASDATIAADNAKLINFLFIKITSHEIFVVFCLF